MKCTSYDTNDYSVPHTQVRRTLTVAASLTHVRVLAGGEVITEHPRVYGKGEQLEDPSHIEALVDAKRAARHHRGQDRLAQAAPSSRALLQQAAHRGTPLSRVTAELEHAIAEALNNEVPHPNGVRQVLERRREQRDQSPPLVLTLPDNDKARNIVVRTPSLARYDQLNTDINTNTNTNTNTENDTEPTDDNNT